MGLFNTGGKGKHMFYKTAAEIEMIRKSCHLVCQTLAEVGKILKPGVTGNDIDKLAEEFILDHGAKPAFKGYRGFSGTLCISFNEIVVHGIPTNREFKETDIISVDCGVEWDGFFGDAAFTFPMTGVDEKTMELLSITYRSLYKGIEKAVHGNRVGDISYAIQEYTNHQHGYGVVRELVGHGVGRSLHEDPEVPNFGKRGKGHLILEGLVIAIEPMINMGRQDVHQHDDGWTITTKDMKPSAHFEHTVAVKKREADILSDHSYILEAVKNNAALQTVLPKN